MTSHKWFVLAIVTLLCAPGLAAAQPTRRPPVAIDATLSERVKPAARKPAAPAPSLPADKIMAIEILTGPIRADQEAILVRLIADTPDTAPDKPDLLFRLGELYAKQQRTYRLQSVEAELRGERPAAAAAADKAKYYLLRAVRTYKALTDNPAFVSFANMDLALFVYAYTLQSAKYVSEARAVYDKLLKTYPSSKYVPEAHFAFAEYYFETGALDDAAARYRHVLKFPRTSVYWYAMYKLGWIELNRSQHEAALETFFQVARATTRDPKYAVLHRSAKQDFVRAYAEVGKVDKALAAFRRVDSASGLTMLETLADVLVEQGKSDKAIYVLRELMKTTPKHASVCDWQYQIALATLSLPGATHGDKVREVQDLVRLYRALVPKRMLPAPQAADCGDNAAAMAGELARAYHAEWSKTKSADSLAAASKLYATYLGAFADAADYPRTRYFYAELLWSRAEAERDARLRTEYWEAAATAFTEVVQGGKLDATLVNESAYAAVRAWLYAHESDPRTPAKLAATTDDAVAAPKPLPEREQKMLAAFDLYLTHAKSPPEDELVQMKFLKANVLRRHDHLAAAIPLFRALVAKHPQHALAEDAALLLLDSLVRQQDEQALAATVRELLANKPLVADKQTLRTHLDRLEIRALRLAAERIEKQARASKDFEQLVRCGQAYLDIYNKRPDAAENDEILYNAGVCFEDGRSIGAALRMYQLLERFYPASKLAARAVARLGKAYADIAFYDQAAQKLEQYAKKYAGEQDAYHAMSDAVFYAKGIGADAKAIENTRYFVKTFGAKQPAEAANAAFSLTAIYEKQGDADAIIKHLRAYIRAHGTKGGVAKLVIAHTKIGQLLFEQSCPVKTVDGACAKVTRERAVASRRAARTPTQCGPESKTKLAVVPRDARKVRDALEHFALASKAYGKLGADDPDSGIARHYHAQGKLAEAAVELEGYFAIEFPANLDFDPKQPATSKQSLQRFDAWFARKGEAARQVNERLAAVLQIKDSASSIAAAARIGQVAQHFSDALFTAEIPKNVRTGAFADEKIATYCDVLTDRAEPLATRALEAYGKCLAKSTELGWFSEWSRLCERELGQLEPETYPTTVERRAEPDRAATIAALEGPAKLD